MACPRCGSERVVSGGFYITKLFKRRNRYKCQDCKKFFIVGKRIGSLTLKQENDIIRLSKKINPFASIHDTRRHKTYSIREIEKITGISHTAIEKVLKERKR